MYGGTGTAVNVRFPFQGMVPQVNSKYNAPQSASDISYLQAISVECEEHIALIGHIPEWI